VNIGLFRFTAFCISLSLAAPMVMSGPLGNAARSSGLLQPVGRAVGLDPVQAIAPVDNLLESGAQGLGLSTDVLQLSPEQLNDLSTLDDGFEESPLKGITQPLGDSLAPLTDTLDTMLDPLTDPVDAQLEPVLDVAAPVSDPLLNTLQPITSPVDGLTADLTGGSLEDALTNSDDDAEDGNGVVNDLLGRKKKSKGRESGESSPLPAVSNGIGKAIGRMARPVERTLDPVTDPIDDVVVAPVLEMVSPVSEPLLSALEPVTAPVDGTLADVTGGSVEDALSNNDDNTADGDGLINDLFSDGSQDGADSGEFAGDGIEESPFPGLTAPLGEALSPVVDFVDATLNPLTDPVDDVVLEPVLDAVAPVTDPVLEAVEPLTNPVDGITADLTGGSLEDALTNADDDAEDGNGVVNDLLGRKEKSKGRESGESSSLPVVSNGIGKAVGRLARPVERALDPVTDPVDDVVVAPILEVASPVSEPLLSALEPVTAPVDGTLADVTGGSVEDALTNNDDNTADGDGLINDLFSDGSQDGVDSGSSADNGSLLEPVIDVVDATLDPVTDPIDDQVVAPILEAGSPVTDPAVDALDPVIEPVDSVVAGLGAGSVGDALTNQDDNSSDGDGAVNDLLGGDSGAGGDGGAPADNDGLLEPIVEVVDATLDPVTDPIDTQVEPILDVIAPVTEPILDAAAPVIDPVDEAFADLGGGSIGDALTNSDENSADGSGAVNDLLGDDNSSGSGDDTDAGGLGDLAGSPVFGPIVELVDSTLTPVVEPVVEVVDTTLDPVTDPVDQIVEPVLDVAAPILNALDPVTSPVDNLVGDITDGSVSDALTNQDANTSDGNGLVNDALGGDARDDGDDTEAGGGGSDENEPSDQPAVAEEFSDDDRDGFTNTGDTCSRTRSGGGGQPSGCKVEGPIALTLSPVNFALNEAVLRPEARERLLRNVEVLQKLPFAKLEVAGHTDALGDPSYNAWLSKQRAKAVTDFLVANGIAPSRLIVRGYRDKQPVADNDSEVSRYQNRRAELIIREAVAIKTRE